METARKTKKAKKSSSRINAQAVLDAYRNALLMEGKKPASIYKFCIDNGFSESEFYNYFGSFEAVEKSIWKNYFDQTVQGIGDDSMSSREKILTFYFTLAAVLKEDRSFVLLQLEQWKNPALVPQFLKPFKSSFDQWVNDVLNQGKQSGEVAQRPFFDTRYNHLFWLHLMFILQFWSNDDSAAFEKTDAAIEKSVNLAFDLIGKGVLDNALDFGKFLYQHAKN